jgi:serine/threonine protein kinase
MVVIQLLDKIKRDEQIIYDLMENLDKPKFEFFIGMYKIVGHLGSGAFGEVFKGVHSESTRPVAIKIIDIDKMMRKHPSESIREKLRRYLHTEEHLMRQCHSAFVVKLYETFQNSKCKVLIMEYCRHGALDHFISERGALDEEDALVILRQIILGLSVPSSSRRNCTATI